MKQQIEGQLDIFGQETKMKIEVDWPIEAVDKYGKTKRAIIKAYSFEQACYRFKKTYGWYWTCYEWN